MMIGSSARCAETPIDSMGVKVVSRLMGCEVTHALVACRPRPNAGWGGAPV